MGDIGCSVRKVAKGGMPAYRGRVAKTVGHTWLGNVALTKGVQQVNGHSCGAILMALSQAAPAQPAACHSHPAPLPAPWARVQHALPVQQRSTGNVCQR